MMNKPELLVTAASMEELLGVLEAGADAVVVGESRWGMRLPGEFPPAAVREAVKHAHERGKKLYVCANNILENEALPELPEYLRSLDACGVDAVVYGDPALLAVYRAEGFRFALHWNAEMTSTNYATANFWAARGAARVVLARELNMEQIADFVRHAKLEVQVQAHGLTNIYHSKRRLVDSYANHHGLPADLVSADRQAGLVLVEAERRELRHPVYEDANGTHIMSADDVCMLDSLPELLDTGAHSVKIEGLLKSPAYNIAAVRAYREAIDGYAADPAGYRFNAEALEAINRLQDPERELTYGFFYKEQVY